MNYFHIDSNYICIDKADKLLCCIVINFIFSFPARKYNQLCSQMLIYSKYKLFRLHYYISEKIKYLMKIKSYKDELKKTFF